MIILDQVKISNLLARGQLKNNIWPNHLGNCFLSGVLKILFKNYHQNVHLWLTNTRNSVNIKPYKIDLAQLILRISTIHWIIIMHLQYSMYQKHGNFSLVLSYSLKKSSKLDNVCIIIFALSYISSVSFLV